MPRHKEAAPKQACIQCQAHTANRGRCKRMTCKYGFQCWQHSIKHLGLSVKKSTIPGAGQGLFTEKRFEPHTELVEYKGEKLTNKQLNSRYPGNKVGPYAVRVNRKYTIDGARSATSSIARYANDAKGPPGSKSHRKNNADLVHKKKGKGSTNPRDKVFIESNKRPIPKNTEVLVNYGSDYWNNGEAKQPVTRRKKSNKRKR